MSVVARATIHAGSCFAVLTEIMCLTPPSFFAMQNCLPMQFYYALNGKKRREEKKKREEAFHQVQLGVNVYVVSCTLCLLPLPFFTVNSSTATYLLSFTVLCRWLHAGEASARHSVTGA